MAGDVSFIKIGSIKIPKSSISALFIAVIAFIVLLILGKPATATVLFLIILGIGCIFINLFLSEPYPFLWAIGIGCLFFALLLGIGFVSSEWKQVIEPLIPKP